MTICPTKKFSQEKVKEMVTAPKIPQFQKLIDDTGDFLRFDHFFEIISHLNDLFK